MIFQNWDWEVVICTYLKKQLRLFFKLDYIFLCEINTSYKTALTLCVQILHTGSKLMAFLEVMGEGHSMAPGARISWSQILLTHSENCTILCPIHCVEIGEQTRCIHRNIVTKSQKTEGDDWKGEKVFQFQYDHFNQFQDWISLLRCQELENVKTNYPFHLMLYLRITKRIVLTKTNSHSMVGSFKWVR